MTARISTPLSGYYTMDSELGLVKDPNGNTTETIKVLAWAVFRMKFYLDEIPEIKEHLITLCLKAPYKNNPLARDYLNSMMRLKDGLTFFISDLDFHIEVYLKLYEDAPSEFKPLLTRLHKKFPDTFEHLLYILEPRIRSRLKDPWLIPCMEVIEKSDNMYKLVCWSEVVNATEFTDEIYVYMIILHDLPFQWIERELNRFPGLEQVAIPPDVMKRSFNEFQYAMENKFFHVPGFDWSLIHYKNKTDEEYQLEEWESRFPLIHCRDQADLYLLKREGFAKTFGYGDQGAFGALMHQSVLIGVYGLTEKLWGFRQLLALAQLRRNYISVALNQWNKGKFGLPTRYDHYIYTRCNQKQYTSLGKELAALMKSVEPLDGEKEIFQMFAYFDVEGFERVKIAHDRIQVVNDEEAVVIHTESHEVRQQILSRVEAYFDATQNEQDPKIIVRRMGLVFYWICRGKFFDRGDPSIAEIVVRSYCKYRGISLGAWKEGIVPWEKVVLTLNPEEFGDNFHTLFEESI